MGLSVGEFCSLFCCPPCPSRIFNKLAFLQPEPSYRIKTSGELELFEAAEWQYEEEDKRNIRVFFTPTSRGGRIACMHVKCSENPRFTILFSLGNAVDLGKMSSFFLGLGKRLNCNIFSYDYSGYGASLGEPSEKNIYPDIEAAWKKLKAKYGVTEDEVVLYGQSLGCGPTIHLASKTAMAGVILQSPFMSFLSIIFKTRLSRNFNFLDGFNNIEKIGEVGSPVLVIHGTEDEIIDISHGRAIHEACPRAVEPLWVEGAGQNDLELHRSYLERLDTFLTSDLQRLNLTRLDRSPRIWIIN